MNTNKLLFGGCICNYDEADHILSIREVNPYGIQTDHIIAYDENGMILKNTRSNNSVITYEYEDNTNRISKEIYTAKNGAPICETTYHYHDDGSGVTKVVHDRMYIHTQTTDDDLNIIYDELIYIDGNCYRTLNEYADSGVLIKSECIFYIHDQAIHYTISIYNETDGHLISTNTEKLSTYTE